MWNKYHENICTCERIIQVGHWQDVDSDGHLIDGPQVQCEQCGLQFLLTWEQWDRVPVENKAVVRAH